MRSLRLPASIWLALAITTVSGIAQVSPPNTGSTAPRSEAPVVLEVFTVTGSNIRRTDVEKTLPVTSLTKDDIDARGGNTFIELMEYVPQLSPVAELGESQALTGGARGDLATVALRGLSSGNTLVLVNGRRLAPFPVAGSENQTPALITNVNQIPTAAIERVEILRDGASAIYGSDATAGVINTILKRNYNGLEFNARYGESDGSVLKETKFTATFGRVFNEDRTSLSLVYDYFDRTPLLARERKYAKVDDLRSIAPYPWNGTVTNENDFDNRAAQTEFGSFRRGSVGTGFVVTNPTPRPTQITSAQMNTNGTFFMVPTATSSIMLQAAQPSRTPGDPANAYYFDINPYRFITPATTRHNLYSVLEHKLNKTVTVFGELAYYMSKAELVRDPAAINSTADNFLVATANNPYNPFGSKFFDPAGAPNADGTPRLVGTPSDVIVLDLRKLESGERPSKVESDALRMVAGATGNLNDNWRWNSSILYAANETRDEEGRNYRESKVREALARTGSDAFNPFPTTFSVQNGTIVAGAAYTNPASVMNSLVDTWVREGESTLTTFDIKVDGHAFELPAGPIAVAGGGEWRHDTYDFVLAPFAGRNPAGTPVGGLFSPISGDNDFIAISPSDDTHAQRDVYSAFAEVSIPVFSKKQKIPLAQSLEVQLAARYEKYSDFGDTLKPKYGFNWRAAKWISVRASYNEGFRAPNIAQLFSGALQRTNVGSNDPYRGPVTALISDTSAAIKNLRRGNDQLKPEETTSRNAGVVIEVPFVKGLSLAVDYYKIQQKDAIGIIDFTDQLNIDRDMLAAETQRQIATGTPINNVDLTGKGNPNVTRFAVTQDDRDRFATFNSTAIPANQRGVVGALNFVNAEYVNAAARNIEGFDFAIEYRSPMFAVGRFTLKTDATYTRTFEVQNRADQAFTNQRWRDGLPLWRGTASVRWEKDKFSLGALARFIGSFQNTSAQNNQAAASAFTADYISGERFFIVAPWWTYNVFGSYRFGKDRTGFNGFLADITLRAGVNNVLNEDPPLADAQYAFNQGLHNARGRSWYLEVTKKF